MDAQTLWRRAYSRERQLRRTCVRDYSAHNWRAFLCAIQVRRDLESCRTLPREFALAATSVR